MVQKPLATKRGIETLGDACVYLRNRGATVIGRRNPRILVFIACFPKSGSTFLMTFFHHLTGFPRVHPVEATGATEQDFSEASLKSIRYLNGVCHQHLRATSRNLTIAERYDIKPLVLVRNIYDIVPSLRDHFVMIDREFPTGFVPGDFATWKADDQFEYVIRIHLPWYFSFLMSWCEAESLAARNWMTYEEMFSADMIGVLGRLARQMGLNPSPDDIAAAVKKTTGSWTRKNAATTGRGAKLLSNEHKELIRDMARLCTAPPDKLSLIGIE